MASSELLKQIQAGKSLKKAVTHDRSAPVVGASKGLGGGAIGGARQSAPTVTSAGGAGAGAGSAGPPQIGGLFAGGIPKLKPAGSSGSSLNMRSNAFLTDKVQHQPNRLR
jgi:WAS/WASL-interacting protein